MNILLAYKFRANKGDTLEMHLFVTDGFNIQLERPIQISITKSFELITQNGTINLLSNTADGTLPVFNNKVDFEGLGMIEMERDYAKLACLLISFRIPERRLSKNIIIKRSHYKRSRLGKLLDIV